MCTATVSLPPTSNFSPELSDMTDSDGALQIDGLQDGFPGAHSQGGDPYADFIDPSLGYDMQRMLTLTDRLRSVGAQAEIDIPQVVVIGDQSTGKSSLLHRISGVPFHTSSGTCTRVPSEIILKNAPGGTWECTVSIRYIRDASGTRIGKPRTDQFGDTITKPAEVKYRMAHAQLACLNPSRPPSEFLEGAPSLRFKSETSFSDNCVVVQIKGPGVPNLSLCDLPGLIASVAKGGNEDDIDMIRDLVASYIKKANCLILLTVSCETDFETQGAYRLAMKYDPEGKRTLGVLTKPDRIPPGDEGRWLRLVKNEEDQLDLGWFCVKQPDSKQVSSGITLEKAQEFEEAFFEEQEPWRSLYLSVKARLGVKPLVDRVSKMLAELISRRLPEVREEVEKMILETKNAMKGMPVPPSEDVQAEATVRIMEFCKDIDLNVTGRTSEEGIIQKVNLAQEKLKISILSAAPKLLPYTKDVGFRSLPSIEFLEKEGNRISCGGIELHLDDVMDLMNKARARELPGYISFDVPVKILNKAMKEWPDIAKDYYTKVYATLFEFIKITMQNHFDRYLNLHGLVQRTVNALLDKLGGQTESQIDCLFDREAMPFTLNSSYLMQYENDFLAFYKKCRQQDLNSVAQKHIEDHDEKESSSPTTSKPTNHEGAVSKILSGLNAINIRGVKASDLSRLQADPFDPALQVMAQVSAYYQVAAKRFIDSISLGVDYELVRAFAKEISRCLLAVLNKGNPREQCIIYMREAHDIQKRRVELRSKLERLEAARQELNEYSPW